MGLMDIGSNNPYAIINPFAAVIDQGMKGWRTTSDRIAAEQKDAAAQAQQAQILEFAKQDAARKQAAEVDRLNALAKEQRASQALAARTVPQYGFQQGPTEPIQAPMNGLMQGGGSVNPFQDPRLAAMVGPQEMPAAQPVASMGEIPKPPMTQREMMDFRAQYAGTPTAEAVGQNAVLMAKENPNEFYQKLLASGKYTPESVVDFAAGKGKLQFAKDPSVVTWSDPFVANVGGKKALVQQSSTGQIKPVIEDKSTTIINKGDGGRKYEFKDVMGLRKEFSALPEVKDYVTIDSQARRAKIALSESLESGSNNTPVDQTIITTFNKILDPTSVVRESEYARTPDDMAVLNRLKGKWDKIAKGGAGLDRETRAAMLRMVENFHNVSSEQYKATVENYSEIARRNGFDPRDVIKFGHSSSGGAAPKPATPTDIQSAALAELARRRKK